MKKNILMILIALLFVSSNMYAQCPGCVVNTSCVISPAYPTTCPYDTLPSGVTGNPYDNDITFYMPEIFEVTSPITQNVHLDELKITNVTGLPSGLNWQTNSTDNTYHPSAGNEHGCAKVCGTPMFPGVYTVIIYFQVTVTPQTMGSVTVQNESTTMTLIINQNPSGNSAFTIAQPQGCAPHTTSFGSAVSSGGSPLYQYSWDFGNGQTSNVETPPAQTYTNAGSYLITQTTNMLAYTLTDVTFDVGSNTNWCGDIDEPNIFGCTGSPDLVFELRDNTSTIVYTSSEVSNSTTGAWNGLGMQIQNSTYTMQFWDIDAVSANDDLGIFTFTPTSTGTFSFSGGGASGTYTIGTTIINSISASDSVTVFPTPQIPNISFFPNDSVCDGDSIILSVLGSYNFQWYNDTNIIYNAIDSLLIVKSNGNYWVSETNQFGCSVNSNVLNVNVIENPPKPNFGITGSTLTCLLTGVNFQWYQNGNLIPGATNNSYTADTSSYYSLVVTNSFGCYNTSDSVFITVGINENDFSSEIKVYPNPSNGKISVIINNNKTVDLTFSLSDITGRELYSSNEQKSQNVFTKQFDFNNFGKGMFILNIKSEDKQFNKRIVIE